MDLVEVTNGFGTLLPHRTFLLGSDGEPSTQVVALRSFDQLYDNVTFSNPILPVPSWDSEARLPDGSSGNHFIAARFTAPILVESVLTNLPEASVTNNLSGTVSVVALDPATGQSQTVRGRVFIDGSTFGSIDPETNLLAFERWVDLAPGLNGDDKPTSVVPEGLGFPGTQQGVAFPGADDLVAPNVLVFVVDEDDDLSTHETFPEGRSIRMRLTTGVISTAGDSLVDDALASSTVGLDELSPEVGLLPSQPSTLPGIIPGNGATNVDPATSILVQFSEPVQPTSFGALAAPGALPLSSSAVQISFGPPESLTVAPFLVRPASIYDFSVMELIPTLPFPGSGPAEVACSDFSLVNVQVSPAQFEDLQGNVNNSSNSTAFETGQGEPVTNAPVAPDVIVVGRAGSEPSIGVIDLNGFGASTGNPTYDPANPVIEENSNFPNNPNVASQASAMRPPLAPGTCTVNGGSSGVFSLTKNSALDDRLLTSPDILSIGDMMIGHPLDLALNNGPPPFGCQSGAFNVCATNGFKIPSPTPLGGSSSVVQPAQTFQVGSTPPGAGNIISWAPHPNPPPLVFPPPCFSPYIGGQEPTSVSINMALNGGNQAVSAQNLLSANGNPFGNPNTFPPQPPTGLLALEQNTYFIGPVFPPPSSTTACLTYQIRQQIGHFLYVVDQVSNQIVVVNSNTFEVIDRVSVPDPTSLAMSPTLDLLAVTSRTGGQVFFVDIDPNSPTFHEVVETTPVGFGPSGIAWQPDNEDIFVCNEADSSVSVISAFDLTVRKTLLSDVSAPFEVAVTERQTGSGLSRRVYYAFILSRNGRVAFFEAGPEGPAGLGADNIIGQPPFTFSAPRQMQRDQINLNGGVWIVHENPFSASTNTPLGIQGGAVTNLVIQSTSGGGQQAPFGGPPSIAYVFDIAASIGPGVLTGVPVDIAFDNLTNLGGLNGPTNADSGTASIPVNSKHTLRNTGGLRNVNNPRHMFLAIPNSNEAGGVVDVIDLQGGLTRLDTNIFEDGIQSVPVTGVRVLTDYWRQ